MLESILTWGLRLPARIASITLGFPDRCPLCQGGPCTPTRLFGDCLTLPDLATVLPAVEASLKADQYKEIDCLWLRCIFAGPHDHGRSYPASPLQVALCRALASLSLATGHLFHRWHRWALLLEAGSPTMWCMGMAFLSGLKLEWGAATWRFWFATDCPHL